MREFEYELLLDAVRAVVAPVPEEDSMAFLAQKPVFFTVQPRKAANDNQLCWPLVPFPDGWNGAC
jgi:hypothetical protein